MPWRGGRWGSAGGGWETRQRSPGTAPAAAIEHGGSRSGRRRRVGAGWRWRWWRQRRGDGGRPGG
ncbi:hypothetical protein E2562_022973 [Oryza meyeriana var. granulata]|uniref:Uncharacterized protein n=1 Tax=Oryza meyeriana var. granulata TaxID=110450 RepID=A0A6G1D8T9_9ORYZ|nr:hypothetical protein E2562_022973 [Oryza meyeriana var. granulata]